MVASTIQGRIQQAVSAHLGKPVLLAVSGGIDSMVMAHAAMMTRPASGVVVATFDHGSGPHATDAVDLVVRVAMSYGFPVVVGRAESIERPSEAEWREQRFTFLRAVAAEYRASIATAHIRDDQVETVLFRELRGAGARGLAGLAARGHILRPLLAFSRADIADYARLAGVEWVDDPTNLDRSFTRNWLRHDLLPALRAVAPSIDDDLASIGARAAEWREEVRVAVDAGIAFEAHPDHERLVVSRESLAGYPDETLAIVWQELLGRIGLAADWRGTRRLVAFTNGGSTGQRIQLSGGWTVHRRRRDFEVGRDHPP